MDPTCVFNFFTFFERILYKSNCIIFIFSWCGTHTIRSKLVVIVTAGSQKITLWGPQRTPLGILRVNSIMTVLMHTERRHQLKSKNTYLILSFEYQDIGYTSERNTQVDNLCLGHLIRYVADVYHLRRFPILIFVQLHLQSTSEAIKTELKLSSWFSVFVIGLLW